MAKTAKLVSDTKTNRHVPVLRDEVMEQLRLQSGMTVIDGTLGNAGHAEEIAKVIGETGTLIGIDADPLAITESKKVFANLVPTPRVKLVNTNFASIEQVVVDLGISSVQAILLDLGLRRGSLEDTSRGFSFQRSEEVLDMRFNPNDQSLLTAREIVNTFASESLADLFYYYADERRSRQYADAIVTARNSSPIETVGDLVKIIDEATPSSYGRPGKSNATKIFQALRMTVNKELEKIEQGITGALKVLEPGGRLVIITFHSIEDRFVKQSFRALKENNKVIIDPKKAVKPSRDEIVSNRLSRSAVLRAITKI